MTTLTLPSGSAPSNLLLKPSVQAKMVDGDLYDICERIKEISTDLYILELTESDVDKHCWAIMERCVDGVERLVYKTYDLDGRVLSKLRRIMNVPLDVRIRTLEKEEHVIKEEQKEAELDQLYENLGRPMLTQLEHDGFIQRPVSYPKRGVAGGKGSRAKS